MKPKLHFHRYEFKYVLPLAGREDLEMELGYFMDLDPYVSGLKGNKYFVRSLYFDDVLNTKYYEKTDGVSERKKYRLRTYTDDAAENCACFLEVKGRHNALVYKHRVEVPHETASWLQDGLGAFMSGLSEAVGREDVFKGFSYESYRMGLKPRVLIDYMRRPYVSKYAPDFRVTFDDSLSGTVTGKLFGSVTDRRMALLPGYTIVEVKFRRHIPSWFHRLIQYYEMHRISVSKYCRGMEVLGQSVNLE